MRTAGNVSDVKAVPALLERAGRMRYLLGNKGYDADQPSRVAHDAGAIPIIPGRRNRRRTVSYDKQRYAGRHRHRVLAFNESSCNLWLLPRAG